MDDAMVFKDLEPLSDNVIRLVGSGIEIFGVLIIVTGIAWSTYLHLHRPMPGEDTEDLDPAPHYPDGVIA